ncbi:MAG TPA: dihydrolipoamide acetyltransferase family protein [Kofleriaceae bacterium]|nr:dihydrolipoamide acetyltransferase family protein [Kofleriaceae bacterium]
MTEIRMPSLGADMESGTLLEWRVAVGDHVARGAVVGLIETEKATMELESFTEGEVEALLVEPGTKVAVGTPLVRLRAPGEHATAPGIAAAPPPVVTAPLPAGPPPPVVTAPLPAGPPPARPPAPPSQAPGERVRSSPAARKRARELGISLRELRGTGPHGAVVLRDVVPPAAAPAPAPAAAPPPARAPARRAPPPTASPMRDAIAAAMARSKREIPHYYLSHTISLKRALSWLSDTNAHRPIQDRILPGALLLRAAALALWDIPELNGFWIDGAYRPSEEVHLGTAVALRTGGLIAPAILDADDKPLDQLMTELRDLVGRTRAGRLRSSELTAATITVTSLGDRGCEAVWPVINPPQVAIVGFGTIVERPWVEGATVVPHPTIVATLAADHRVSDGHRGGLYLAAIDHLLQEPDKL